MGFVFIGADERDGAVFVGQFEHGKVQGSGRLTFSDGQQSYVGEFVDGKRHGEGTYSSVNSARIVGEWRGDSIWKGKELDPSGKTVAAFSKGVRTVLLK